MSHAVQVLLGSRSILVVFSIVSLSMAASNIFTPVSQEEFMAFHTIDRNLYSILVMDLWRDPVHSMQVLALWIWLERVGYYNTVKNILSLPQFLIYELADEAITCLSCFNNLFVCLSEDMDIPLMRCLMQKDISLVYFLENRLVAAQGVTKVYNDVCVRALTEVMHQAVQRNHGQISMDSQMGDAQNMSSSTQQSLSQPVAPNEIVFGDVQKYARERQLSEDERTMFVTFSKGYPVQEQEVREFLTTNYGDCIESLYMQEVGLNEQALYARVIFQTAGTMDQILGGRARAKFSINGKHVWLRKFVRNHPRPLVPLVQGMLSYPFPYAP